MNSLARFMRGIVTAVPIALLSGCYQVSHYSGDGQLIDNGPFAATDRYVLNLSPVDLTQRGKKTFRMANLPEANFVTGFEISVAPEDRAAIEQRLTNPTVSLELSETAGKVLFSKASALDAWTWSVPSQGRQAFVYGSGEPGTYFNAVPGTEYTLTLSVLEPDRSRSRYATRLVAKSGGWK